VQRFWDDWGMPALAVLVACDLQALLRTQMRADSFQRVALTSGLALTLYLSATSDIENRWTHNLTQQYLTQDNPELTGWLPEKSGIFFSADMSLFYQTFLKNPKADWRYILGFEPTSMPEEDFKILHNVWWNFGDAEAYQPWVDKMHREDRLVMRGQKAAPPKITRLEWNFVANGIWIGRLPQPTNGAALKIP